MLQLLDADFVSIFGVEHLLPKLQLIGVVGLDFSNLLWLARIARSSLIRASHRFICAEVLEQGTLGNGGLAPKRLLCFGVLGPVDV